MNRLLPLVFLATTHPCFGLDAEAMRNIADRPHSRVGLLDELKIFCDGRQYEVTSRTRNDAGEFEASPKVVATEKVVEGKYIVTVWKHPGVSSQFVMIVSFDQRSHVYRKWLLLPDEKIVEYLGTAVKDTRALSWISVPVKKDSSQFVLSSELHTDDGAKWSEIVLDAGKVVQVSEGEALKTK